MATIASETTSRTPATHDHARVTSPHSDTPDMPTSLLKTKAQAKSALNRIEAIENLSR
jgi:hypothetical protein